MTATASRLAVTPAEPVPAVAHTDMANAIRALAMDAVEKAKSGHPGMPMGMADVATVLFTQFLKFDPADPHWPDRDRFVLSAGHGSMLLYALLYLTGYAGMTLDEIKRFRQLGSQDAGASRIRPRAGHRDDDRAARAGPRQRASAWRWPSGIWRARSATSSSITAPTCIAGDGCLMEGISQEAIALAGHLKLNKLIVLLDDNGISHRRRTVARPTRRSGAALRGRAAGTRSRCDGHDRGRRSPRRSTEAQNVRQAGADRLQDHHRLRRAEQGRHRRRRTARRSAPTRSRARARSLGWPHRAVRDSRRHAGRLARGRRARAGARAEWSKRLAAARRGQARRVRAAHDGGDAARRRSTTPSYARLKLAPRRRRLATRASSDSRSRR